MPSPGDSDTREPAPESPTPGLLQRLLPSGVLGLAGVVFFMGLAAAFTGAVLYAYYESRLEKTENALEDFILRFTDAVDGAVATVQSEGERAREQIEAQLEELEQFSAGGETLTALLQGASPSVWFVETLDETGAPSVGTAFVVFADNERSYLLASYTTVRAATAEPGPDVVLRQGDRQETATVFSWDPGHDLALLTLDVPSLPALAFAPEDDAVAAGDRVFVVSGLGASGGAISQGFVADVAGNGIQHDVPVGAAYQGGPLLDSDGEVLGVASRTYAPLGFDPLAVFFAPPVRAACEVVIQCPAGAPAPPG
ncbi:MAG: S1 family peptidase [Acidimicrobiales bacterium]